MYSGIINLEWGVGMSSVGRQRITGILAHADAGRHGTGVAKTPAEVPVCITINWDADIHPRNACKS